MLGETGRGYPAYPRSGRSASTVIRRNDRFFGSVGRCATAKPLAAGDDAAPSARSSPSQSSSTPLPGISRASGWICAFQSLQRCEKGPRVHLEHAARDLLHASCDPEPVHGLEAQCLENEEIERALDDVRVGFRRIRFAHGRDDMNLPLDCQDMTTRSTLFACRVRRPRRVSGRIDLGRAAAQAPR